MPSGKMVVLRTEPPCILWGRLTKNHAKREKHVLIRARGKGKESVKHRWLLQTSKTNELKRCFCYLIYPLRKKLEIVTLLIIKLPFYGGL